MLATSNFLARIKMVANMVANESSNVLATSSSLARSKIVASMETSESVLRKFLELKEKRLRASEKALMRCYYYILAKIYIVVNMM